MNRRGKTQAHESAWLYLSGYALRPGYGHRLDSFRVSELWNVYKQGPQFPRESRIQNQWWLMWRRVAGGLGKEEQELVFSRIYPQVRNSENQSPEMILLAGSLERIEMNRKIVLGNKLADQIRTSRNYLDQKIWALTRLASRVPLYGGAESIIRPKFVESWIDLFKTIDHSDPRYGKLAGFYSQAGRLVGDREFDISDAKREEMLERMKTAGAEESRMNVLMEIVPMDESLKSELFGEELPSGLVLT
ncbi:MAG: hypothetical protein HQK54_17540 [Oligoflexales bacterium]|nr:hypothetical protein [Oligoflexales bacterium]